MLARAIDRFVGKQAGFGDHREDRGRLPGARAGARCGPAAAGEANTPFQPRRRRARGQHDRHRSHLSAPAARCERSRAWPSRWRTSPRQAQGAGPRERRHRRADPRRRQRLDLSQDVAGVIVGWAARANVTIYALDPRGLHGMGDEIMEIRALPTGQTGPIGANYTLTDIQKEQRIADTMLRTVAEGTGGIAMVDANQLDDRARPDRRREQPLLPARLHAAEREAATAAIAPIDIARAQARAARQRAQGLRRAGRPRGQARAARRGCRPSSARCCASRCRRPACRSPRTPWRSRRRPTT